LGGVEGAVSPSSLLSCPSTAEGACPERSRRGGVGGVPWAFVALGRLLDYVQLY